MNKLHILSVALLCAHLGIFAAGAASSSASAASSSESGKYTITEFLRRSHVDPGVVPLSAKVYYEAETDEIDHVMAHLEHIERETLPVTLRLFTQLVDEERPLDTLLHAFIVNAIANRELSKEHYGSSMKFSSARSTEFQTRQQVLEKLQRNNAIARKYFNLMDVQPPTTGREGFRVVDSGSFATAVVASDEAPARVTISSIGTWLVVFKQKQASGEVSSTPEDLIEAHRALFDAQREKIYAGREYTLEQCAPGIAALQTIIATPVPAIPTADGGTDDAGNTSGECILM